MKRILHYWLVPLMGLLATACSAGERYALVIGVNSCPDFEVAKGVPARPLLGAESDARAIAELLRAQLHFPEANVELLTGQKATYEAVKQSIRALQKKASREDCVVLYFSGHGTQLPDRAPLDESDDRLDEALCLADAKADGENLVVDDELGRWLADFDAAQVTVILDCCHAGTATKDDQEIVARYLPFPGVERVPAGRSAWREVRSSAKSLTGRRATFFACQPDQQAFERRFPAGDGRVRSGQFTQYLVQGMSGLLADTDKDGLVSAAEAVTFVRQQLDQTFNVGRKPQEQQQPYLESDDDNAPAIVGRVASPGLKDSIKRSQQ